MLADHLFEASQLSLKKLYFRLQYAICALVVSCLLDQCLLLHLLFGSTLARGFPILLTLAPRTPICAFFDQLEVVTLSETLSEIFLAPSGNRCRGEVAQGGRRRMVALKRFHRVALVEKGWSTLHPACW
jgi:hypothetical protein